MTILITGASSGIGEALAIEAARRGMNVVLCARRKERLEALAKKIDTTGRKAMVIECDVTKREQMDRAVRAAQDRFKNVDVVIANAGFGVVGAVENLTIADYERQFATNVYGVINTFQASYEALKLSQGRFAAVGSVNGYVALPGNSPYAMSKFAVRALCDSLRFECAEHKVSVTHIAPGFVVSEIRHVDNQGVNHPHAIDRVPAWIQMPADKAARQILRAVMRRRAEIVVTGHGKLFVLWVRHCPWSLRKLLSLTGLKARREAKSQ